MGGMRMMSSTLSRNAKYVAMIAIRTLTGKANIQTTLNVGVSRRIEGTAINITTLSEIATRIIAAMVKMAILFFITRLSPLYVFS
jgi:hypothetical protein